MHERSTIQIIVRCRSLAAERGSGALARASRLAELSPQSLHARELPGLSVGRATSELRPVRTTEGRRVAVYVPEELVPEVRRWLDNGRALQELLQQAAPRYVKALKRERAKAPKSRKS